MHARILSRRFRAWLLTTAACGGLRSAPVHRTRRAILHLSCCCAAPLLIKQLDRGPLTPRRNKAGYCGARQLGVLGWLEIVRRRQHDVVWPHEGDASAIGNARLYRQLLVAQSCLAIVDQTIEGVGVAEEIENEGRLRRLINFNRRSDL